MMEKMNEPVGKSDKLKPCPFCGGEAKIAERRTITAFVYCPKCDIRMYGPFAPYEQSLKGAVEKWNRREQDGEQ